MVASENRDVYILPKTDNDSHISLLVHFDAYMDVKQAETRVMQFGNCEDLIIEPTNPPKSKGKGKSKYVRKNQKEAPKGKKALQEVWT